MIRKLIVALLVCAMLFSLTACDGSEKNEAGGTDASSDAPDTTDSIENENAAKTEPSEIEIYQISRETFESFLFAQSVRTLNAADTKIYSYPDYGQWYYTQNVTRFEVQQSLIDFVGDPRTIENYLAGQNIGGKYKNALIIEAPYVPMTIWIETDQENVFVTIDEAYEEQTASHTENAYRAYMSSSYVEKYRTVSASLKVKDTYVQTDAPIKIYSDSAYSDLPLSAVLEALGATLEYGADGTVSVLLNERQFCLDIENKNLYEIGNEELNLLIMRTGRMFICEIDGELMVDSTTLYCALTEMGEHVTVKEDKENGVVIIE